MRATTLLLCLVILLMAAACEPESPESAAVAPAVVTPANTATPRPTATPLPPITTTLDCNDEKFTKEILKLSGDNQNPLAIRILKLYSGAKETERTERVLRCKGEARLDRGEDSYVTYYLEIDRDGDQFIWLRDWRPYLSADASFDGLVGTQAGPRPWNVPGRH